MAANTVFIINNTIGTPIAAIQPNTLNGPGPSAVQQSSDLSMFGLGYALWGQASDQNDYRLLENFACPQSILNPSPVQPMGEAELGPGNGINAPLVGQLWFNTDSQIMYVNTNTGWQTITLHTIVVPSGAINPSPVPPVGSLFFNTGINQLLTSNGSIWESVAGNYLPLTGGTMAAAFSMGLNQINNLATPTAPYDAANKQYVDTVAGGSGVGIFVPLAGGTMTGTLHMSSAGITLTGGPGLSTSGTNITVNTGTITVNSPPSNIAMTANGRILNVTTVAASDAVSSTYGDTRWLNKATGGTVTGSTTFSNPVTIPVTPTVSTEAASKGYVDTALLNGFTQDFATTGSTWPTTTTVTNRWCKLPNGMIMQWGFARALTGGYVVFNVTLPVPFTNTNYSVSLSTNRNSSGAGGYNNSEIVSASVFTAVFDIGASGYAEGRWMAIGN